MRAHSAIVRQWAREAWQGGSSFVKVARACKVPVGTVKAWASRGRWKRERTVNSEPRTLNLERGRDATGGCAGKTAADATTHRGLRWQHMPGRGQGKKLTFALFRAGEWPPIGWHVPAKIEGGDLMMLLHERACMNERRAKR
jgi:hypothetical protein